MSTTALDAKTAIKAIIDGAASLSTYQRTWGFPTKALEKKAILLGDVKWPDASWATNRSRQETYRISFSINVQLKAGTAEEVETLAVNAAKDFEDAVKQTPNLGLSSVTYTDFQYTRLFSFPTDEYYEGQLDGEIEVHARIPNN